MTSWSITNSIRLAKFGGNNSSTRVWESLVTRYQSAHWIFLSSHTRWIRWKPNSLDSTFRSLHVDKDCEKSLCKPQKANNLVVLWEVRAQQEITGIANSVQSSSSSWPSISDSYIFCSVPRWVHVLKPRDCICMSWDLLGSNILCNKRLTFACPVRKSTPFDKHPENRIK